MTDQATLKVSFPDKPPKKQIQMIKDFIGIVRSIEKLTGEVGSTDLTPFTKKIRQLQRKIKAKK